jgi:PhnB protein
MSKQFKPTNYNSLSPYLIVADAQKLVDLLKIIFDATELRRLDNENGKIRHIELKLDDTVIMLADSVENYPANKTMLHIYVPDVFKTFDIAMQNGCEIIEKPVNKSGDPDTRGGFMDFAGNYWYVSTQTS